MARRLTEGHHETFSGTLEMDAVSPLRVYSFVVGTLRSNRTVFRMLFGYTPPPDIEGHLWDWTTLALRGRYGAVCGPAPVFLTWGPDPRRCWAFTLAIRFVTGMCARWTI